MGKGDEEREEERFELGIGLNSTVCCLDAICTGNVKWFDGSTMIDHWINSNKKKLKKKIKKKVAVAKIEATLPYYLIRSDII